MSIGIFLLCRNYILSWKRTTVLLIISQVPRPLVHLCNQWRVDDLQYLLVYVYVLIHSWPCTMYTNFTNNPRTTWLLWFVNTYNKIIRRIKLKSAAEIIDYSVALGESWRNHIFFLWFWDLQKVCKKMHNHLYFFYAKYGNIRGVYLFL